MPRLFIAIELPEPLKDRLAGMKGALPAAAWVKRDGFHLTLRFLGDVESARIPALVSALHAVTAAPFPVTLSGVGRFPPQGSPRVVWVGVEAPPALMEVQQQVERALTPLGFPPEDRPFSAHITLARLKSEARREVEAYLEQHRAFRADPFTVSAFYLIESTLTPAGAKYRHEAAFALSKT
jgi:2'-5' RNA ligase